ncbi:MAG: MBL fold metallo-hydrolase [Lachnospiraceae bacterium]|nr:MBL fold metallo-hydrolase [Lachnospiraceae bacterium]
MKFFSLASGSSGNAIYLGTGSCNVLIDAGISAKRICEGLQSEWIQPESLDAILVTHEHSDHTQGLAVFMKKYRIPVYASGGTIQYLKRMKTLEGLSEDLFRVIKPGSEMRFGDVRVSCCGTSHDAAEPVAFAFTDGTHKIGMATDLGCITPEIVSHLSDSEVLYLESNYDRYMLLAGSYPYSLKQRIMSVQGHLSNEDSARLVSHVLHEKLKAIVLAHLSKENNMPDLALLTMKNELDGAWNFDNPKPRLLVAPRDVPMEALIL